MPRQPGSQTAPEGELTKFTDTLMAIYDAWGTVVHHQEGTIDIYPNPKVDTKPPFFTIAVAPANKFDEKIKKLNASKELFYQFIKSKVKEKEESYKINRCIMISHHLSLS